MIGIPEPSPVPDRVVSKEITIQINKRVKSISGGRNWINISEDVKMCAAVLLLTHENFESSKNH